MKRTFSFIIALIVVSVSVLPTFARGITAGEAHTRAQRVINAANEYSSLHMVCDYTEPDPSDPIRTSGITGQFGNIKRVTCCKTKEEAIAHPTHYFDPSFCLTTDAEFIEYGCNLYVDVIPTEVFFTEATVIDYSDKAIVAELCTYLYEGEKATGGKAVLENKNGEYLLVFMRGGKDPGDEKFDTSRIYSDVGHDSWFRESVDFAFLHDIMNGVGGGLFAPNTPMNRAMLVTVLWRTEGEPKSDAAVPFTDLTADWYKEAVRWAYEKGIVNGVNAISFAPDYPLTREQITTILFRYAKMKYRDISVREDISTFPDFNNTDDYALEAMSWAVGSGLISGVKKGSVNYLDPIGNATRAQVSAIMTRYLSSPGDNPLFRRVIEKWLEENGFSFSLEFKQQYDGVNDYVLYSDIGSEIWGFAQLDIAAHILTIRSVSQWTSFQGVLDY